MKRFAAGFVIVVGLGASGSTALARSSCAPYEYEGIVARSGRVVLLSIVPPDHEWFGRTTVCSYRTGRRFTLREDPVWMVGGGRPARVPRRWVAAAGDYVAFMWEEPEGTDDIFCGITIANGRTGRSGIVTMNMCAVPHYKRFVLRASGAIAWTHTTRFGPTGRNDRSTTSDAVARVWACRRDCYADRPVVTELARGHDIDLRSLHKTKTGVAWTQSGRIRRAWLP